MINICCFLKQILYNPTKQTSLSILLIKTE
jgi:hypothetical protein